MTFTHALSTNNYGPAKFVVSPNVYEGTHTTIQAAITAASSGDTVFIRAKSTAYTENLTLKAGVNLTAYECDSSLNGTGNVIISGKCSFSSAGSVTISGIQLQTNSDFLLAVTGSAASIVNLVGCYLNCSNNTGVSFTTSNTAATIETWNCSANIGTTGISYATMSSTGSFFNYYLTISNTGASTTATTVSAGILYFNYGTLTIPITTSSTGGLSMAASGIDTGATNTTILTIGGSGLCALQQSYFSSGTASAITISSSASMNLCTVSSTNTNAITGAGTIVNAGISFPNTSSKINTTTQTARNFDVGGISFDGGTNVLSNYATGTFTPTMVGNTTPGTTTYTAQNGYYTRIGQNAFLQGYVAGSAATGTGATKFGGLPFTIKSQTNGETQGALLSTTAAGWVYPAGATSPVFYGPNNNASGLLWINGSAATSNFQTIANASFTFEYSLTHQI